MKKNAQQQINVPINIVITPRRGWFDGDTGTNIVTAIFMLIILNYSRVGEDITTFWSVCQLPRNNDWFLRNLVLGI